MDYGYNRHWQWIRSSRTIQRAVIVSVAVHTAAGYVLWNVPRTEKLPPVSIVHEIHIVPIEKPKAPEVKKAAVPKPKPRPKPKPKPKAEVKPEPKPKPKPKPKPEPKVEKVAKAEPAVEPAPKQPPRPVPEVKPIQTARTSVQMEERLPPMLNSWGRLVQRKVEKYWSVPGGLHLEENESEALVSFWVDRNGNIVGRPQVVKQAGDPAVAESGVRAVLLAAPLPPLPPGFLESKQEVVYSFSLVE